jgi:hypothetical protein
MAATQRGELAVAECRGRRCPDEGAESGLDRVGESGHIIGGGTGRAWWSSAAAPLMETGFDRSSPSSTAVVMIVRNSRRTAPPRHGDRCGRRVGDRSRPTTATCAPGSWWRRLCRPRPARRDASSGPGSAPLGSTGPRTANEQAFCLVIRRERMRGIEPPYSAWEADVLPLNYIRARAAG